MHTLQKILLKRLYINNRQRYGSLASGYDFEDNVVYHLNQLQNQDLIEKNEGVYKITLRGLQALAQFEPESLNERGVKTFFIGYICTNHEGKFLLKSHKNAKLDFYNLPSYKPGFGEDFEKSIINGFFKYTNLSLKYFDFKFVSLHLKTIQNKNQEVIFDDAFSIFEINLSESSCKDILLPENVEWFSLDEIRTLVNRWPEIDICILNKDYASFKNYTVLSDYIL